IDINHAAGGNLKGLSSEEAWETIEDCVQCDKQWKSPTPLVTCLKEVEETIRILMEVEPLDHMKPEDLGLNTCSHDLFLSSRKIPSFDDLEPQPKPLPNYPSLDISLGEERGPNPPIKPNNSDSCKMKLVDHLTIDTPPSTEVVIFYHRDVYCHCHPCLDDPKKTLWI
nr:hypothetical protein [Tanacetum cinerariifolium]